MSKSVFIDGTKILRKYYDAICDDEDMGISKIDSVDLNLFRRGQVEAMRWIIEEIDRVEALNQTSHWHIFMDSYNEDHAQCAHCGFYIADPELVKNYDYCPHCGAQMKGVAEWRKLIAKD